MTGIPEGPWDVRTLLWWARHDPKEGRESIMEAERLLRAHLDAFDKQFVDPSLRADTARWLGLPSETGDET